MHLPVARTLSKPLSTRGLADNPWRDAGIVLEERGDNGTTSRIGFKNAENLFGENLGPPVGDRFVARIAAACPGFPLEILHGANVENGSVVAQGAHAQLVATKPYLGGALACVQPAFENLTATIDAKQPHHGEGPALAFPAMFGVALLLTGAIGRCVNGRSGSSSAERQPLLADGA